MDKIEVEINGEVKEFSAEDITGLVSETESLKKGAEVAKVIVDASAKYETDPETYIKQAEGSFGVVNQLIEAGIIDEKGEIVKKEEKLGKPEDKVVLDPSLSKDKSSLRKEDLVAAVTEATKTLQDKIKILEEDQSKMFRMDLEKQIKGEFPVLDSDDISKVFGAAMRDRSKDLMEHAKERAEALGGKEAALRKKHAEEFGINLDEFDENKLLMQESGGGTNAVIQGKEVKFEKRIGKEDKNTVTPRQLLTDFLKRGGQVKGI